MDVVAHLISMPWSPIDCPSIQTGCLKAYLDEVFAGQLVVRSYSPFYSIFYRLWKQECFDRFQDFAEYGENIYFLLYARRFGLPQVKFDSAEARGFCDSLNGLGLAKGKVTSTFLAELEEATVGYIDSVIGPRLVEDVTNVIGFTLNFDQVYSSFFCARYLKDKFPEHRLVFVFGGASAALHEVLALAKLLEIEGYCVVGEGEKKCELIVRGLMKGGGGLAGISGLLNTLDDNSGVAITADLFKTQFPSLEKLPTPAYSEFFSEARKESGTRRSYDKALSRISLPVEGTRGCFAHCDFCGLNYLWKGFRKRPPEKVFRDVTALVDSHGTNSLRFVDNVCDTWAEGFADRLIAQRLRFPAFMELRAHHPEHFWTKLALSGANRIQIGIEAISPPLLAKIGKGTRVIQNIMVHKYFRELGIHSCANLITHHPRSTLEDVEETMRIAELISHLEGFGLSPFTLIPGSPLYEQLDTAIRQKLKPNLSVEAVEKLDGFLIGYGLRLPEQMALPRPIHKAWDFFRVWYAQFQKSSPQTFLTVSPLADGAALIKDGRYGPVQEIVLRSDEAQVYSLGHRGLAARYIAEEIGQPLGSVTEILDDLTVRKLMLKTEDYYLSLAIRPRADLVRNYERMV